MASCGDCRYYLQHHCFSKPPVFTPMNGWCRPPVDPKNPICTFFEWDPNGMEKELQEGSPGVMVHE